MKWVLLPGNLISIAYLTLVVTFAAKYMQQGLWRSWFFSSDEYVFGAEVIRFANFDFHQHFFDMPGTPFIMLDSIIWRVLYTCGKAISLVSDDTIGAFTFHHVSGLFILMRATTLVFFLLSVVLLFVLVSRLFNKAMAAVAALLLVMSPIYTSYSSFVRVESLAMVLILGALILMDREMTTDKDRSRSAPTLRDPILLAGLLMGLAAGARLHALTAGVPVLLVMIWLRKPVTSSSYPVWVTSWARYLLPLSWGTSLSAYWWVSSQNGNLPAAVHFVGTLVVAWLIVSVALVAAYRYSRLRSIVVRVAPPAALKLFLGLVAGVLIGIPTIITQYKFFLGSVDMYSRYLDLDRMSWSLSKLITWYLDHYLKIIAPDQIVVWMLAIGALWIVLIFDRRALPYLIGAALFFVSKPLKMVAAPHHVILWLPFFFLVCAYPAGKVFDYLSGHWTRGKLWATPVVGVFLTFCFLHMTPGPKAAVTDALYSERRMHNIQLATDWIKANTDTNIPVAISYFCFNPDVFYVWLASLEVPVPDSVFDGRRYLIWWGHRSALHRQVGYACVTHADIVSIKTNLDIARPGEGTDPYTDKHFKQVAAFGSEGSEVDLFRFDLR
jgi:hypothetical protein